MSQFQFHLAFPVRDLQAARAFYIDVIGCRPGRETDNHLDFDMFGHHVVAHLVPGETRAARSEFDGHEVPVELVSVIQGDLGISLGELQKADLSTLADLVAAVGRAVRAQAGAGGR